MNPKDLQTLEKLLSVIRDHGNLATSDEVALIVAEVLKEIKQIKDDVEQIEGNILEAGETTSSHLKEHEGTHKKLNDAIDAVSSSVSSLSSNHDTLKKLLSDLKDELDSRPGMEQFVAEAVKRSLAAIPPCETDTADDIRNKLELLKGDDRLDRAAIRGLEEVATNGDIDRAIGILDKRTSFLINKAPSGGGVWGGITGTLANQTDLQTALNAKQATLTLTTTGSSGAATLVGSTLNIPQYSGAGASGITRSVNSISGNTTAGAAALTDYVYLSTATLTLTLPTAVGNLNQYVVKSVSGTTTIATTSAQTINGSATVTIAAGSALTLISDNANWHVV